MSHRPSPSIPLVTVAWLVGACGGTPAPRPAPPVTRAPPPAGRPAGPTRPAPRPAAVADVAVPDIGCLVPTCALHPGTGTYFTCTSSGTGACVHFGAPCAPADRCMYDPAARVYKLCTTPVEGTCQAWGAACAPASGCMFDARDGYHHTCADVAGGACRKFGPLCTP